MVDRLEAAIDAAEVGRFDGEEFSDDSDSGTLFMVGPDAEALWAVVRPILVEAGCLRNLRVTCRQGS